MLFKTIFTHIGLLVIMLGASPAWAVQTHGGSEGLVAHQIGHILFIIGMAYLLFRLYHIKSKGTGWTEFKVFLVLSIAWNGLTFAGHWLNELVASDKFNNIGSHTVSFSLNSTFDFVYYLSRLDHLVLVPAFLFLLLALRKWRAQ